MSGSASPAADTARMPRSFFRDALALTTGSGVAQALSFGSTVLLSRLYAPEAFGVFGIYAFLIAIPTVLVCGCYEPAILLPDTDAGSRRVVTLSFTIAATVSLVASVASLSAVRIAGAMNAPDLAPWLGLMPVQLLALGIAQALTYWLTRERGYRNLGVSRVVQSVSTAGGQIGGAALSSGAAGLVGGQVLGQILTSMFLLRVSLRQGLRLREPINKAALTETLVRFRRFPLYTSWGTLTGVAAVQILTPMLSRRFGPADAGLYFFGFRLMSAAILLFSGSLGHVFFERASSRRRAGQDAAQLVRTLVRRVAFSAAVPFILFAVFGEDIFALAFGAEWRRAGLYMSIMAPAFFMQLITAPVSLIFFVLEKQHVAAGIQVVLLASSVVALVLAGAMDVSVVATLAIYSAGLSLVYAGYLLSILRHVNLTIGELVFGMRPKKI